MTIEKILIYVTLGATVFVLTYSICFFLKRFFIFNKIRDFFYKKQLYQLKERIDRDSKIKYDIQKQITILKEENSDNKFAAIRYLLEYPSPKGFLALMEMAVSLDDNETRTALICAMCRSSETCIWHP